jgi:hypothetical protein
MNKNQLLNGNIYEIPLPNKYGFGYVKYINSRKEFKGTSLADILLVFDYHSLISIKECSVINRDLLIAPITISGSSIIPKLNWKVICNEVVSNSDKWLPEVKSGWPPLIDNPTQWVYFEELGSTTKMHFSSYEKVKHLDWNRGLNVEIIAFRIYFELLRKRGQELKGYIMNFFEENEYKRIKDLPVYSSLPIDIKGKALR